MRSLVTGGAGFIGSYIVDRLIARNIETKALVSGFRSNKHPSILNRDVDIVKGDLRNYDDLLAVTKDIDIVYHLGGIFSHYVEKYPELAIDVNIKGMWNLKKACVFNGVERIIFASSSFVYGDPAKSVDHLDEGYPTNPKDLLGITKLAGEKVLKAQHPDKLDYTILRLFNVYGPRQYPDELYTSVVSTWIKQALVGKPLEIHDDGTQALDFIYAGDVADVFILALDKRAENETFNVGSGTTISMNELATIVNRLTGNESPSFYNPDHPMFIKHIQADINKIKSILGWSSRVSIEEGLLQTIDFFRGLK